jgi:hypothetical protein
VCVVFGVSFYGRFNVTADARVRSAFQRALYVSAGIAYINSAVAFPDQPTLCGVNVTNTGGFGRPSRTLWEMETLSQEAIEEREADLRRMEVFGESNYTIMRRHVEDMFRGLGGNLHSDAAPVATQPPVPDTKVYFSVISNVQGKRPLLRYCIVHCF